MPTDAAGWRALDHVIHLADWENGMLALLNHQDRAAGMGVDKATWTTQDFDKINDILQKKSKDKTLQQAQEYVMGIYQQFVGKIQSMSDEDLHQPYKYYQPDLWIEKRRSSKAGADEHLPARRRSITPWIAAIVADDKPVCESGAA